MKPNKTFRMIIFVILILANIGCDQISKSIARKKLEPGKTIEIIDHNFILKRVENTGAFLGLGSGLNSKIRDVLFLWFPAIIIILLLIWFFKKNDLSIILIIALSFIIGGGIGNLYDRILYGSVTDFLHIDLGIVRTGIFNLADVSVTVGVLILLIESFFSGKPEPDGAKQ